MRYVAASRDSSAPTHFARGLHGSATDNVVGLRRLTVGNDEEVGRHAAAENGPSVTHQSTADQLRFGDGVTTVQRERDDALRTGSCSRLGRGHAYNFWSDWVSTPYSPQRPSGKVF